MAFDLNAYLAERKQRIESALFAALPDGNRCRQPLADAMAHALKAGGKRLRPILCLAAAESVGGDSEPVMPVACAVEILHNYTLVHDDLPCMDNDTLRRGQPTVWYRFSEGIGVLAGDALLTLAFEWLATFPESRVGVTAALVGELARAAGALGVIGGQVEDIQYDGHPTREGIESVFQHKTADLFKAACRLGGIAAGADAAQLNALSAYADHLGFAFQIQDDLLDAATAKADARPELSCLDLMTPDEARAWAERHTAAAVAALEALPGPTEPMRALVESLQNRRQ